MAYNNIILICILVANFLNALSLRHENPIRLQVRFSSQHIRSITPLCGYVAPEKDPEYRTMVKKSLLQIPDESSLLNNEEYNLPLPKEGDIVECPGKWQGERVLGKLRSLQYSDSTHGWRADILPLKDGKSNLIYSVDKDARILTVNITEVAPVKAYFVRAENAYNVTMKAMDIQPNNSGDMNKKLVLRPALRAPRYRILDQNFTFATKLKKLTTEDLEDDMEKYSQLKNRIIVDSLKLGGLVSVAAWVAGGVDVGFGYTSGCLFGAAYLYLLGKRVDVIGYGISSSEASRGISKKDEILANGRFYTPLALIFFLAARHSISNSIFGDSSPQSSGVLFHLLEKDEFLAAIAGFLTHRFTLFYTEILGQMTQSDWLSFLPGSFAETFRQKESLAAIMSAGAAGSNSGVQAKELVTVICVTGPQASGRSAVVNKFLNLYAESIDSQSKVFRKTKMFLQPCNFVTTDARLAAQSPDKYQLISKTEFDVLTVTPSLAGTNVTAISAQAGQAVFIGNYTSVFEGDIPIALLNSQLLKDDISSPLPASLKRVYLVEGSPPLMDALSKVENIRVLNVWISLQTKEQFIAKATQLVQNELTQTMKSGKSDFSDKDKLAQLCASKMAELVNEAARDVQYYMQRAPMFEFTLLNADSDEETAAELLDILQSAFQ